MPKPKRRVVVLAATVCAGVLAVVLLVSGFSGGGNGVTYVAGSTNAVLYGSGHQPTAPVFTGTTLTGTPIRFSAYRGQVVVLNFWASWCGPCRAEATTLSFVAQQYKAAGVRFLGVDIRDSAVSAQAFLRGHDVTYPSVSDPDDAIILDFSSVVPIQATPTTLVIDKTGHVAGAVFGPTTYAELNTIVSKVTGTS